MINSIRVVVSAQDQPGRLDYFLAQKLSVPSRSRIKTLIEQGQVLLNSKPAKPSSKVKSGDKIEMTIPKPLPAKPLAEAIPLQIFYQDRDLIVIDKPAGMMTHPVAGKMSGTLVNALLNHCKDLSGIGGELKPGIVHRLDKLTSGVMVSAKTELAHLKLAEQFKQHSIERAYWALARGNPEKNSGRIESKISRNPRHRLKMTGRGKQGRVAITEWKVIRRFKHFSVIECRLHTGRTHQIRVHLTEMGFPLVGDALYGGGHNPSEKIAPEIREAIKNLNRQALHAFKLGFAHPRTGQGMSFCSPLPEELDSLLRLLEKFD